MDHGNSEQVVLSLLTQQFWDPPDGIVDRTRSTRLQVAGSKQVFESMAVILISGTEKLDGRDLNSFYAYLRDVAQKLGLEEQSVIETFEAKTADLISLQNHIEETVLLVFAVGAILSTIRALKQETLLFSIRSAVKDRFEGKWSVQDDVELTKELDFLFQTSDSDLSLLLNLGVLAEMAHCLKLRLSIVNFEEYVERITHRLISKARNDPTNQIDPADQ
ncbi:MAG: hypothetical protein ACXAB4_04380 [Candidatus Hodarchaeales archaeon]